MTASSRPETLTPTRRMRRIVANIEIIEGPATLIRPSRSTGSGSNFALGTELVVLRRTASCGSGPGRATDLLLRRVDGELRMAQKVVELVDATEPQTNLTFLI